MRKFVSDFKGGTSTEGVREEGYEENVWAEEGHVKDFFEKCA
jgi:hypothetical protein